ncbi:MAG: ATP-binding SpoIIE family protein phosphatase [Actinomycetota bacterium]
MKRRSWREIISASSVSGYAIRLVLVALAYYLGARLGLRISIVGRSVSPLWPPTGIAVVALLAFGFRIWPAIALAAFSVNAPISPSYLVAAIIGAGNTLAPITAVYLLRRVKFRPELDRMRDALAVIFLAALGAMTISATIGTTALVLGGAVSSSKFFSTWSVWWAGDAMGVLLVAPFFWSLRNLRSLRFERMNLSAERVAEAILFAVVIVLTTQLGVRTHHPVLFPVLPILGAIAWRFQVRGSAPAGLYVSIAVIRAAASGSGPFLGLPLLDKMIILQLFNATVACTSFFFAAVVSQELSARESETRMYEREHRIAETLQRSLLPETLPHIPGFSIAARYISSEIANDVGGDWYDVIVLPGERIGISIGDVAGHGIAAAAVMGQIRVALRAYVLDGLGPRAALDRVNELLLELYPSAMATLLYAEIDPDTSIATIASAGHPPALHSSDGSISYVEGGLGPPLGVTPPRPQGEVSISLLPDQTLLLFTDGLIERRDRGINVGLDQLQNAFRGADGDIEHVCDYVLDRLLDGPPADDVAMLALRRQLLGPSIRTKKPALPATVPQMRHLMQRWLVENRVDQECAGDVLLAFSEAYTNAVRHAYRKTTGEIEVEATVEARQIQIAIRDWGVWSSPLNYTDAYRHGLDIMRATVDSVEIIAADLGTEVRLRHSRKQLVSP